MRRLEVDFVAQSSVAFAMFCSSLRVCLLCVSVVVKNSVNNADKGN